MLRSLQVLEEIILYTGNELITLDDPASFSLFNWYMIHTFCPIPA